jgi:two-component system NtrC family sensor kinase
MLRRLSLKAYLFLWVLLAVAGPLAAVLFGATAYSERLYNQEVQREIIDGLNNTASTISRRFFIEQDLASGLSQVPAIQAFLPALQALAKGEVDPQHNALSERVTHFFETFQGVRRSLGTVRILDSGGDTLIKVRNGQRVPATLARLDSVAVVENGSEPGEFHRQLDNLGKDSIGSLPSPPGFDPQTAVLNTVAPLLYELEVVGYLAISPPLDPLDRTLDVAPRPYRASLFVAEIDSADPARNGRLLYDDATETRFADVGTRERLQERYPSLFEQAFHLNEGRIDKADGSGKLYFVQLAPYADRLISWLFVFEVEDHYLNAPFRHTTGVVLLGLLLALIVALLLARLGVRQIATPVSGLTQALISSSRGQPAAHLQPTGPVEIQAASQAFNQLADSLETTERERDRAMKALVQNAKLASVGQLAAGISHEISNPLNNIYSLTKLLQRHLPDDDQALRQDVVNIREEAERASRIIRGLLNFSRQVPTNPTDFDCSDWVRDGLTLVQHAALKRQIEFDTELAAGCIIHGDHDLLRQALINLLLNAIQASPERSRIRVKSHLQGQRIELSIRDRGAGIEPEIAEKLFDPFFTTKGEGEGTGLGLSICLGIVEHHDGTLRIDNAEGGGAQAVLTLPCASSVTPADDEEPTAGIQLK